MLQMSAGPLEEAGLAGPSNIRAALGRTKKAHTLINAVKKFQTDNSIKVLLLHILQIRRINWSISNNVPS